MTLNDDLATKPAPPATAVLTVSQLHEDLRSALEDAGLARVWVSGVVTGLRRGPRYQLGAGRVRPGRRPGARRAVGGSFPPGPGQDHHGARRRRARVGRRPRGGPVRPDGLQPPGFGRLRLLAEGVDPPASVGAAVLARDAVVAELEAAGDLAAQRALALPAVLQRVGLVSSPTAAGRADVLAVLERCSLPIEVVETSAAMGGPQAPAEVATALGILARADVDVIVVAPAPAATWRPGTPPSWLAPSPAARCRCGSLSATPATAPWPTWWRIGPHALGGRRRPGGHPRIGGAPAGAGQLAARAPGRAGHRGRAGPAGLGRPA